MCVKGWTKVMGQIEKAENITKIKKKKHKNKLTDFICRIILKTISLKTKEIL